MHADCPATQLIRFQILPPKHPDCELAEEDAYAIDGPAQAPALLELRDAMSLVWRVLLLWLAVLALFVIAGFVN